MSALEDYKQLLEAYPNANKFLSALKGNVSKVVPTREELEDPEKRYEFAMNAATNAPMGLAIKAYHGTPHSFDKFDMSKIGTGEGAQAYGHGLYFAESPATAKQYSADRSYVGSAMQGNPKQINYDDPAWISQNTLDQFGNSQEAIDHLKMVLRTASKNYSKEGKEGLTKAIDMISSGEVKPKGNLYKDRKSTRLNSSHT